MAGLRVGQRVISLVQFVDSDSNDELYVHAEPGEYGRVVSIETGCFPTVEWERTRTLCDVADDEIVVTRRRQVARG